MLAHRSRPSPACYRLEPRWLLRRQIIPASDTVYELYDHATFFCHAICVTKIKPEFLRAAKRVFKSTFSFCTPRTNGLANNLRLVTRAKSIGEMNQIVFIARILRYDVYAVSDPQPLLVENRVVADVWP